MLSKRQTKRQLRIIGSTGGTLEEFRKLVANSGSLKIKIWKTVRLEEIKAALESPEAPEREGRILVKV
ncbi:hypothetical protein M1373_02650 [Candidatus Marsarchaeota archaeon]|nr:hypothetical protein [Candidatus Marsarchaeota archaeon]MCL5404665.1 hypothetical protein [Candidatus Marsarchaeota archaeon]